MDSIIGFTALKVKICLSGEAGRNARSIVSEAPS